MRRPGWPGELDWFLAARQNEPFRYGRFDCCLFVADAVLLMTGVDLAAEFRNRYSSRREAITLLRGRGVRSIRELIARNMAQAGFAEILPSYAGRGDACLLDRPGRDSSLGLVDLTGHVAVLAARGLLRVPVTRAARAWRI